MFEKPFVAIRHESDMMTPLIESPFINFSVRELGYIGVFGLATVFAVLGNAPTWLAIATSPLFALAVFKWRGEIPEMYFYFAVMSFFEPSKKAKRAKKSKKIKSDVMGFGGIIEPVEDDDIVEVEQKIKFIDENIPLDITLDIGNSHSNKMVIVLINGVSVVNDRTNSAGQIVVSIMPESGTKKFSVCDEHNHIIITKTVEFYDGR